jgi:hypothetical protein
VGGFFSHPERNSFKPHSFPADHIPTGIDEYNKKIMVASIKDPDLFWVGNQFTHDVNIRRLGINPLVKRCRINLALWFLVVLIMMGKLVLEQE